MAQSWEPMEIDTEDLQDGPGFNPDIFEAISRNLGASNYNRGNPDPPANILADYMQLLVERNTHVENAIQSANANFIALLQQRLGFVGQSQPDAALHYSSEDLRASHNGILKALQIIAQGFGFQLGDVSAITNETLSRLISHVFLKAAIQDNTVQTETQPVQPTFMHQTNNIGNVEVQLQLVMQRDNSGPGNSNVGF